MNEKLEHLVDEVGALQSKLVLLIGPPNAGKTALLNSLAKSKGVTTLNVGAELGGRLAGLPQRQRHLQTTTILRELADQHAPGGAPTDSPRSSRLSGRSKGWKCTATASCSVQTKRAGSR